MDNPDQPSDDKKPQVVVITSLDQLSGLAREPKKLTFDLPGKVKVELKVRPLNSPESVAHDEIGADLLPPKKPAKPVPAGRVQPPDEYDYDDPEYKKKANARFKVRRAYIISTGLVDLAVPGENLDQKAEYLERSFPPRVLEALYSAILSLTSDPIETASFS